jgi:acyl dehydratase
MSFVENGTSFAEGAELPSLSFEVTRAQLVRYAGASLDFNPIHWSDAAASAAGLPDVIAHGMLSMAFAGRIVTNWAGPATRILDFRVRFSAPVPVPATGSVRLEGSGVVVKRLEDEMVEVEVSLRHGDIDVLKNALAVVQLRDGSKRT